MSLTDNSIFLMANGVCIILFKNVINPLPKTLMKHALRKNHKLVESLKPNIIIQTIVKTCYTGRMQWGLSILAGILLFATQASAQALAGDPQFHTDYTISGYPQVVSSFTYLYTFNGTNGIVSDLDGLIYCTNGLLYGETGKGGLGYGKTGAYGTVFSIFPGYWNPDLYPANEPYNMLYNFGAFDVDGNCPMGPMVVGWDYPVISIIGSITNYSPVPEPALCGTTLYGGAGDGCSVGGAGTAFKIDCSGYVTGSFYEQIYGGFDGYFDWPGCGVRGTFPEGLTVINNVCYGTTTSGGIYCNGISPVLFSINIDGDYTSETIVHDFSDINADETVETSAPPIASLHNGACFGMVACSFGTTNHILWKMNADGPDYTVLHAFLTTNDYWPICGIPLISDDNSNVLYGVAVSRVNGTNSIFKIDQDGKNYTNYRPLFTNLVIVSLTLANNTFYGIACQHMAGPNWAFKVNTDGTGYTKLHDFGYNENFVPAPMILLRGVIDENTNVLYDVLYGMGVGGSSWGFIFALPVATNVIANITQTFSTPGTTNWVCPTNLLKGTVLVECWGGGGGGGAKYCPGGPDVGAGGGGGGAYAGSVVSVVPGQVCTLVVGAGGNGYNILDGGDSTFGLTNVVAKGEKGVPSSSYLGGLGGQVADCTGTTVFRGGNGASVIPSGDGVGAGGGGGAGSASAGGDAIYSNTGVLGGISGPGGGGPNRAHCGGNGGLGGQGQGSWAAIGYAGSGPGGGGGGSFSTLPPQYQFTVPGSSGGSGKIMLTYTTIGSP